MPKYTFTFTRSIYKLIAQSRLVDDLYPFIPSSEFTNDTSMSVCQYNADMGTDE